jgi:hypothetical protein
MIGNDEYEMKGDFVLFQHSSGETEKRTQKPQQGGRALGRNLVNTSVSHVTCVLYKVCANMSKGNTTISAPKMAALISC